jgi:hypothetical protein
MQTFKEFFSMPLNDQQKGVINALYNSLDAMFQRGSISKNAKGMISIPKNLFPYLSYAGKKGVNENFLINQKVYIPYNNTQLQHPANPATPGSQEYILIDGNVLGKLMQQHGQKSQELKAIQNNAFSKLINQINAPSHGGIQLTPSAGGY